MEIITYITLIICGFGGIFLFWLIEFRKKYTETLQDVIESQTKLLDVLKEENRLLIDKNDCLHSLIKIYKSEETEREAEEKRSLL